MTLMGDIHGNFPLINQYRFAKGTNILQVGDFGLGFYERDEKTMSYWNESWSTPKKSYHIYVIRGNHDDPKWFDGSNNGRWSNIHLVPDYTVLQIEGKNILCIGGARSADRSARVKREDSRWPQNPWFEGEGLSYDEDKLLRILGEYSRIDVVVTHCSPNIAFPFTEGPTVADFALRDKYLLLEMRLERELLTRMYDIMLSIGKEPSYWVYGHYHINHTEFIEGTKFICLGIGEITNI